MLDIVDFYLNIFCVKKKQSDDVKRTYLSINVEGRNRKKSLCYTDNELLFTNIGWKVIWKRLTYQINAA